MLYVHRWFVFTICVLSVLLLAQGAAQAASCTGTDACTGNTGTIGTNSCNGTEACENNSGDPIGDNSCTGDSACEENDGSVGNGECTGKDACFFNNGSVVFPARNPADPV
jgi:hypothetical protein